MRRSNRFTTLSKIVLRFVWREKRLVWRETVVAHVNHDKFFIGRYRRAYCFTNDGMDTKGYKRIRHEIRNFLFEPFSDFCPPLTLWDPLYAAIIFLTKYDVAATGIGHCRQGFG